jgi:hypothetical protein
MHESPRITVQSDTVCMLPVKCTCKNWAFYLGVVTERPVLQLDIQ